MTSHEARLLQGRVTGKCFERKKSGVGRCALSICPTTRTQYKLSTKVVLTSSLNMHTTDIVFHYAQVVEMFHERDAQ